MITKISIMITNKWVSKNKTIMITIRIIMVMMIMIMYFIQLRFWHQVHVLISWETVEEMDGTQLTQIWMAKRRFLFSVTWPPTPWLQSCIITRSQFTKSRAMGNRNLMWLKYVAISLFRWVSNTLATELRLSCTNPSFLFKHISGGNTLHLQLYISCT